jgi:hypothetical protein
MKQLVNEFDMQHLLVQFRKAFNAKEVVQLRKLLLWQRSKRPANEQKRLEADLLSINNSITHFYQDSGLDKYVLQKIKR